ncbi:hypothetical protein CY35_05G113100 [Sphagnum magellanicum]|nr:hypothetical protein CY35_05G113100 [Sphagnum magellanicum]
MAVVEAAMRAILAAVEASATVTDEQLSMLNFLFEKNLERALRILDQGGVQRVTSEPSHRTMFQVIGESKSAAPCYLCFPDHYCSCQSFYFDVVAKSEQIYCKHQLAAKLANALHMCKEVTMSDEELAYQLLEC